MRAVGVLVASMVLARLVAVGSVMGGIGAAAHPSRPGFRPATPPDGSARDEQIEWLVATYGPLAYRVAYSILGDAGLAEDVVQEALVKAWTSMPSWEGDTPVRWLRRVVRNTAISALRSRSRLEFTDDLGESAAAGEVHAQVEGREKVQAMARALATLDELSRTLIVLRETDELGYAEIADIVGLTPSAVKAKLYRARHQLKSAMKEWDA
ncbi:MAG: sigma-70 family RNA polymerase sigma factor [Actinomyces sp.]|nr:MAG: sigma-70 family RNA polymerase sigma factor [Actinomyces sp.]